MRYDRPAVSASLIHEVRMIAENFFRQKTMQSMYSGKKEKNSSLSCAVCLHVRKGKAKAAITILDGYAVCADHLGNVQTMETSRIFNSAN
ncbi:MAG: hypothetical protein ACJ74Y_14015 [Bryobacteraceae bacterium]|jgi:hypothetical protein